MKIEKSNFVVKMVVAKMCKRAALQDQFWAPLRNGCGLYNSYCVDQAPQLTSRHLFIDIGGGGGGGGTWRKTVFQHIPQSPTKHLPRLQPAHLWHQLLPMNHHLHPLINVGIQLAFSNCTATLSTASSSNRGVVQPAVMFSATWGIHCSATFAFLSPRSFKPCNHHLRLPLCGPGDIVGRTTCEYVFYTAWGCALHFIAVV